MEYHPDLKQPWTLPPNAQARAALPVQTMPTDDVDKIRLLSQIILRESPIQQNLPLLPQLIERQKLLRHLIYGPTTSHVTSATPTNGISLNPTVLSPAQIAQLTEHLMNPITTAAATTTSAFVTVPSTSSSVLSQPTTSAAHVQPFIPAPSKQPEPTNDKAPPRSDTPIDVVHVDSTSSRSSPSDMSRPRKRKISSDNTSPCSTAEISSSPHLFELSEKNFTEVFCKQESSVPPHQTVSDDRPNTQLIALLNRCVSNMKNLLTQRGVPVSVDDNGMPVDYSSRPVDEIFKQSRRQLEMSRNFQSEKGKGNS